MSLRTSHAALALVLTLTACSVLPKREPTTVFVPTHAAATVTGPNVTWPNVAWSLLIPKPEASDWLDTERIAVRHGAGNVQVYKGASWSDPVPELVQSTLLRGFEDSQKILTVGRPGGGVKGRFQLLTEVRAFESDYSSGSPVALIELQAKLVDNRDGAVVASRNFRDTEAAGSEDVDAVVEAMSRVLDRTTAQVVGWTLAEGEKHEHATEPGKK
jgi:cholesterol transport system auxiliary component